MIFETHQDVRNSHPLRYCPHNLAVSSQSELNTPIFNRNAAPARILAQRIVAEVVMWLKYLEGCNIISGGSRA
jgi:hypothetical protein